MSKLKIKIRKGKKIKRILKTLLAVSISAATLFSGCGTKEAPIEYKEMIHYSPDVIESFNLDVSNFTSDEFKDYFHEVVTNEDGSISLIMSENQYNDFSTYLKAEFFEAILEDYDNYIVFREINEDNSIYTIKVDLPEDDYETTANIMLNAGMMPSFMTWYYSTSIQKPVDEILDYTIIIYDENDNVIGGSANPATFETEDSLEESSEK